MLSEILKFASLDLRGEVRKEADHIAQTIGSGIRKGFEDGFASVSSGASKLIVASFSIVFGILFLAYGLAAVIETNFKVAGSGFLIVGILVLLVGLLVFSSIKKK